MQGFGFQFFVKIQDIQVIHSEKIYSSPVFARLQNR